MKLYHLTIIIFSLAFAVRAGVPAENGESRPDAAVLSLSDVTRTVLENNPSIKSARRKWNAAKARVAQAAAWEDPKLNFVQKLDRFVNVQPNSFSDQIVSVEQMIPISGKNRARARAATAEALSVFEETRRQELDVVAKARASYFSLANVYAQIELNRRNLVSLKQIAEVSRSSYEAGNQSAAFVLTAETEYSKLMEARRDLDQQRAAEESQLNVLMNRDAFAPVGVPAPAEMRHDIPSVDTLRGITLSQRPEVRMAVARVAQARAALQLAHREWIPDPAINIQAQRYNDSNQGMSEVDAGISFNIPWVDPHKYMEEIHEAEENLQGALSDLESARSEAVGKLRDALEKVEAKHHHIELFGDKLVPQAKQAFEASQLGYESGKVSFMDWITAQRNLRDLESQAREHLRDYQSAIAELEAIAGVELDTISEHDTKTISQTKTNHP